MFTRKARATLLASTALALGAIAPAAASAGTITMSGSTSVSPLAAKLAKKYVNTSECKKTNCKFKLLQGGSDVGISDVARGRVTIGMSSRDPKSSDPGGLVFNKIARDAICIITNKSNPLPSLSQSQIQAIFGGGVRDWGKVPGSKRNDTIDVTVRTAASGTQDAFQKIFMGDKSIFSGASQKSSNGLVQQAVKSDPSAVGYVSAAFTDGVSAAPYQGVPCTLRNAKSGQYGGVRSFYMVTRGAPTSEAKTWINWIRKSKTAAKIIASEWVPLS